MLERIRTIINDFEPRNLTARDGMVVFVLIALIMACGGGGVLLISELSQRKNILPTPLPSPISEPAPTPLFQDLEALPTTTSLAPTVAPTVAPTNAPTIAPAVIFEEVNAPTKKNGESCIYSEAWINNVATPIPDGGYSKYEGYLCDNGYWDIGTGDWVTKDGVWGKDGLLERAYIKFNSEGVEIDRMYFDLDGNKILAK